MWAESHIAVGKGSIKLLRTLVEAVSHFNSGENARPRVSTRPSRQRAAIGGQRTSPTSIPGNQERGFYLGGPIYPGLASYDLDDTAVFS
jgi:hypothetical protein